MYGRSREKDYINKHFRFTVTTNGILLDDEKTDFINREMSNVVLSIDGRKEVNDRMRTHINGSGTYDEIIETIRIYVAENPDKDIYHGFGWYNGFFENGMPTADILDDIIPDKPAAMRSVDGHSLWVNSNLLEFAGITSETPDPEGGHIEHYPDGRPNGCFRDQAQNLIFEAITDFTKEEYMDSIIFSQN